MHNNVRSLKRNIEAFQNHLLSELKFIFDIIGVSETRIVGDMPLTFNPDLRGYNFEYVPTPLSAGGVGMYIADNINYSVIERTSNIYFQALWIELAMNDNQSIVCGVVYRQHNDTTKFVDYISKPCIISTNRLKADFQSSHEAPRSSLRVMHEHFHPITMLNR